jgi:putative hydrolase
MDMERVEYTINGNSYSLTADLHTHTVFSHGTGTIEENVRAARAMGILRIGITDHGPGHVGYGVRRWNFAKMRAEAERLSALYTDMEIQLGIEANIVNASGSLDIRPEEFSKFDYVIAGYHYGAIGGNPLANAVSTAKNLAQNKSGIATKHQIRLNTRNVVRALENNDIKILTHPGDKAPVDLLEIAVVCARTDTLVEINTNHMSLTAEDLRTMALAPVRFIISSDAHSPGRVGDFVSAVNLAISAGLDMSRVVNIDVHPER